MYVYTHGFIPCWAFIVSDTERGRRKVMNGIHAREYTAGTKPLYIYLSSLFPRAWITKGFDHLFLSVCVCVKENFAFNSAQDAN